MKKLRLILGAGALVLVLSLLLVNAEKLGFASLRYETFALLSEDKILAMDLQKVIELHQGCFEEDRRKNLYNYYLQIKYPHSDEYFRSYLKEKVEQSLQQSRLGRKSSFRQMQNVTILKKGADIIGMYNCVPETTITHGSVMIYNVCLADKMRGKGIGKNMVQHAIDRCAEPGKELALTVYKDNYATVGLYKKLKFAIATMPAEVNEDFEYFNKYLMIYQP
jgi:ribosomal protein S18 acetylase RimI-like enzyme